MTEIASDLTVQDREILCRVGGEEYCLKISARPDRCAYVCVERYDAKLNWYFYVWGETATDVTDELDAIRSAFKICRRRMNNWARSWNEHRIAGVNEKGGKRAYYGKLRNEARGLALKYAGEWKLLKLIWKEITRL